MWSLLQLLKSAISSYRLDINELVELYSNKTLFTDIKI